MEQYPSGTVLRTPEEMKEAWNSIAVKGDGVQAEGFWPGLARNLHAGGENLMEGSSIWNPLTYPSWLAGASLEALAKPFSDYSKGFDVTAGDATTAVVEAIPGVKLAKLAYTKALGRAALGASLTKKARSFEDMHPRGDWYKGSKLPHMVGMGYDAMKDIVRRAWDPEANALFRKHKISPNKQEEFLRYFEQLDNPYIKKGNTKPSTQIYNEINSEAEYNQAMMEKFFPGNKEFARDMGNHLIPKKFGTTGDNFAGSGIPMSKVLDGNGLTNDALKNHVSAPMVEEFGLKGKDVVLATKPWNDSPLAMLLNHGNRQNARVVSHSGSFMYHGIKGKYNPAATAVMLYKKMDGPFSMDALEAAARKHNSESYDLLIATEKAAGTVEDEILRGIRLKHFRENPLVNVDHLLDSAKVSDGYISFGGRLTGQDRMFANYNTRFVVKDGGHNAQLYVYDEMEQGTGLKIVDKALTAGTKKLMGIDVFPVLREAGRTRTTASQASGGLSGKQRAELTRAALERMMHYESTFKDRAIQAGQTGAVMEGVGSLWQWKDYKHDPSQDIEGEEYSA